MNLLERMTYNPRIVSGKPIIRGHRLAVEHLLGMPAAGDTIETRPYPRARNAGRAKAGFAAR